MKTIYLAGGCFWGMQGYFDKLKGVIISKVGYANSELENPNYEIVCSGTSGAVEAIEICYDENILQLEEILQRFLSIIDPCSLNFQGNDIGTQYRNGIYFIDDSDNSIIKTCIKKWEQRNNLKAVTEVFKIKNFYEAESYHQKYLEKNPNGYCHINVNLALKKWDKY